MNHGRVLAALAKGSSRRRITIIVTVLPTAAVSSAMAVERLDDRTAALDVAWAEARKPALDCVRGRAGEGLRISNLLETSPSFVAVGPRGAWLELIASVGDRMPGVTFEPDDPEWCSAPG